MTATTEQLARTAWDVCTKHADRCGVWHPQLVEVGPDGQVLEVWHGDAWPGGDPGVLLGDWLVGPDTTCLLLVSIGTAYTGGGSRAPVRVLVGVGAGGDAAMFVGDRTTGPVPLELAGYGGEIVTAMRATFDRTELGIGG